MSESRSRTIERELDHIADDREAWLSKAESAERTRQLELLEQRERVLLAELVAL